MAFSAKVIPVSSGAIFVSLEIGKKKYYKEKILLNSLTLFLFCVANIIFILTPLQQLTCWILNIFKQDS